jgi:hypothetical protein
MKKLSFSFIIILIISITLVYSCSYEEEESELQVRAQYTLTVSAGEGGSVSPENTRTYSGKTVVTITAIPDEGYEFARWLGTGNDNKPNPCGKGRQLGKFFSDCHITIEMNSNRDVQVFFKLSTSE